MSIELRRGIGSKAIALSPAELHSAYHPKASAASKSQCQQAKQRLFLNEKKPPAYRGQQPRPICLVCGSLAMPGENTCYDHKSD
jgi:hypothetical protein